MRVKIQCGNTPAAKVNPSERLVLRGDVSGEWEYRWTELEQDFTDVSSHFATLVSQTYLVVKANQMSPSSSYTFRFGVAIKGAPTFVPARFGSVTVLANAPPHSGAAFVASRSATADFLTCPSGCCGDNTELAAQTDFEIASLYWLDDADDLPLQYSFSSVLEDTAGVEEAPLGHWSPKNRIQVQLPPGTLRLTGYVQDRLGASASVSATAIVTVPEGVSTADLASTSSEALDDLMEQADGEAVVRAVGMLTQLLNSDSSDDKDSGDETENRKKKTTLRSKFLQNAVSVGALVEKSTCAIEQQSVAISDIASVPLELTAETQAVALGAAVSLVKMSVEVGISSGAMSGIGKTLSAVLEGGLLEDKAIGKNLSSTDSSANSSATAGEAAESKANASVAAPSKSSM